MSNIFDKKKSFKISCFFILFISFKISIAVSVNDETIIFKKITNKKIEVIKESPNNVIYKKNHKKVGLITNETDSNYYSSGIYNFIEFEIPKETEVEINFNGDCIFPIAITTNPNEFSKSINFVDGKAIMFFNDIGNTILRDLAIGQEDQYDQIKEKGINYKAKFVNQKLKSFEKNHRGIIYCFEYENQDYTSLSFEIKWNSSTPTEDNTSVTDKDESNVIDTNVETTDEIDQAKETISGNNIDLDMDTGSSKVYYENIIEIKGEQKTFTLKNLKEFTFIDIQDLKDNELNIKTVYDDDNKSITQTDQDKKRLESSFEGVKSISIDVELVDKTLTNSFLSFKVTTSKESSSIFFTTTNIIIIAVVCSLVIIILIIVIICCVKKKKKNDKTNNNNSTNRLNNSETVQINERKVEKKHEDDDMIPVYQINFKNKPKAPDNEKVDYPKMEESVNSINKNHNLNYPDNVHESEIKKEPAKK